MHRASGTAATLYDINFHPSDPAFLSTAGYLVLVIAIAIYSSRLPSAAATIIVSLLTRPPSRTDEMFATMVDPRISR